MFKKKLFKDYKMCMKQNLILFNKSSNKIKNNISHL
jgi:hypothetical protein